MSKISKNGSKDKIQKCKGDRLAWHLRVIEDVMCTDEGIDCVGDVISGSGVVVTFVVESND